MLTIRHVSSNGQERVFEVDEVHVSEQDNPAAQTSDESKIKVVDGVEGMIHHMIDEGIVYVMNSHGKTVANYGLRLGI